MKENLKNYVLSKIGNKKDSLNDFKTPHYEPEVM